jgi:hypothetical protein
MMLTLAACSVELTETGPTLQPTSPEAASPTLAVTQAAPADLAAGSPLGGEIIFMQFHRDGQSILSYDLVSGMTQTLYQAPVNAWITGLTAIPATDELIMAYAPAPAEGQAQTGMTDLSALPIDGGGEPQTILAHVGEERSYASPLWSAGEAQLYYGYYQVLGESFTYGVGRYAFPEGEKEMVAENAIWPRLSADGRQLVFVGFEPGEGDTGLFILDLTVENAVPQPLPLPDNFPIVDAPLFSPDGEMIYFSAVSPDSSTSESWWDRLVGVQVAFAHDVPSDWWRMPIGGGEPERLTDILETGLFADFSPDGEYFAFISSTGLYVMKPDGSELRLLGEIPGLYGTLDWIP